MFKPRLAAVMSFFLVGVLSAADSFVVSAPSSVGPLQIHYQVTGPFGGYSTVIDRPSEDGAYRIPLDRDGKQATGLRMILFSKGCQIQSVSIGITDTDRQTTFVCTPLPMITIKGRISPPPENTTGLDLILDYVAPWEHSFFHIYDGILLSFRVGQAPLTEDGRFSIQIPDFSKDAVPVRIEDARLRADLMDRRTLNRPASLSPPAGLSAWNGLKILPDYGEELVFARRP